MKTTGNRCSTFGSQKLHLGLESNIFLFPGVAMAMNDSHRLFLQSIMAHGIFNSNQVLEFYSLACNRIGGEYVEMYIP